MSGETSRDMSRDMSRFFYRGPAILCLVLAICSIAILINDLWPFLQNGAGMNVLWHPRRPSASAQVLSLP